MFAVGAPDRVRYSVRLSERAIDDLRSIADWIGERAGFVIAEAYVDRIEAACLRLQDFPMRGTARDELRAGLRTIGFERSATIAFEVGGREVLVLRVLYGGRDLEAAFDPG